MNLDRHVADVQRQLFTAAAAGGEAAEELADRLTAPLDAAIRLTLLDALGIAAGEITSELAPGSVELRLRAGEPEFVVSLPPAEPVDDSPEPDLGPGLAPAVVSSLGSSSSDADGNTARINLRLPESLKSRVDQAAEREGLSTNAWLVRAISRAVEQPSDRGDRGDRDGRRGRPRGAQSYTGWVR